MLDPVSILQGFHAGGGGNYFGARLKTSAKRLNLFGIVLWLKKMTRLMHFFANIASRMPCDCIIRIQTLIEADRKYLVTCYWIYGVVLTASVILTICLSEFIFRNENLTSLSGLLANGLVFPLVPKHLQIRRAMSIREGLKQECSSRAARDPQCKRIADLIDRMLQDAGS